MSIKNVISLILLSVLLFSCAPAEAAQTETPATEAPAATEEPLPEVSKITFYYELNYVPENWVENYTEREVVTFYSNSEKWSTKTLSPVYLYKGPLFPIQLDPILHKTGNCDIFRFNISNKNNDTEMIVQPVCRVPNSEESVMVAVRLPNCERDSYKNLTCKYFGNFGTLQYTLNESQDIFKFQYSGSWDLMFESAMNTSLALLGFNTPPEEFYANTIPEKIYTIYKIER